MPNPLNNKSIMEKKSAIESAIRNAASSKLAGKYNLPQYKKEGTAHYEERSKAMLHKKICEEIVAFADSHPQIPFYFILSVGVSKGAYKLSEFNKGYKRFNAEEVEAVEKMGKLYNTKNGKEGRKPNDTAIRLMMRYYERKSKDFEQFKADLEASETLGQAADSRETPYKTLCDNLGIPYEVKAKEVEEAVVDEQPAEAPEPTDTAETPAEQTNEQPTEDVIPVVEVETEAA